MPALREKLGDKEYEELESMIVDKIKLYSVSRDEFREVLSRLDIIEHDLSDLKLELKELGREMEVRFDRMNENIDHRLDSMNEDFNHRLDSMSRDFNERFDRMNENIDHRLDSMNENFNQRFDSMNERFDKMYDKVTSLVKWTIGTLALFGTIISILIAIGQFIK